MPTLAVIFGITITMNFRDHLPPHFHARSGGQEAVYALDGQLIEGSLGKQDRVVRDWAQEHLDQLAAAWEDCSSGRNLGRIDK